MPEIVAGPEKMPNETGRPEDAVALTVNGAFPYVLLDSGSKFMVCPGSNEVTVTLSAPKVYGVPAVYISTLIPPLVNGDESVALISNVPSTDTVMLVP